MCYESDNKIYEKFTVDFSIPNGTKSITVETEKFIDGKIIRAALYPEGNLPDQIINLTMVDTSGKKVQYGSTLKDWLQRQGGSYIGSMMPINADGGKSYRLEFSSLTALGAELKGQVVFVIDQTTENGGQSCM